MSHKEERKLERQQINRELQERVEYLLDREMERIRKKCFKRERKPFVNAKVSICLLKRKHWKKTGAEDETHGYCKKVRDKDRNILEYRIVLPKEEVKMYLERYDYDKGYVIQKNVRVKNPIVEVIRHELTHAFVEDHYEDKSKILFVSRDSSPIFLYYLDYFNGAIGTGYKSQRDVQESLLSDEDNIYKKVFEFEHKNLQEQLINKTLDMLNAIVDSFKNCAIFEFTSEQTEPIVIMPEEFTIRIGSDYVNINDMQVKEVEGKFKQYFVEIQKNLKVS